MMIRPLILWVLSATLLLVSTHDDHGAFKAVFDPLLYNYRLDPLRIVLIGDNGGCSDRASIWLSYFSNATITTSPEGSLTSAPSLQFDVVVDCGGRPEDETEEDVASAFHNQPQAKLKRGGLYVLFRAHQRMVLRLSDALQRSRMELSPSCTQSEIELKMLQLSVVPHSGQKGTPVLLLFKKGSLDDYATATHADIAAAQHDAHYALRSRLVERKNRLMWHPQHRTHFHEAMALYDMPMSAVLATMQLHHEGDVLVLRNDALGIYFRNDTIDSSCSSPERLLRVAPASVPECLAQDLQHALDTPQARFKIQLSPTTNRVVLKIPAKAPSARTVDFVIHPKKKGPWRTWQQHHGPQARPTALAVLGPSLRHKLLRQPPASSDLFTGRCTRALVGGVGKVSAVSSECAHQRWGPTLAAHGIGCQAPAYKDAREERGDPHSVLYHVGAPRTLDGWAHHGVRVRRPPTLVLSVRGVHLFQEKRHITIEEARHSLASDPEGIAEVRGESDPAGCSPVLRWCAQLGGVVCSLKMLWPASGMAAFSQSPCYRELRNAIQAALAGEGLEPWQSILIGENHALLTTEDPYAATALPKARSRSEL